MGRIYLIRHGQTTANRDRILQGPRIDGPLSDLGLRQAHSVAGALGKSVLTALYTSPMVRARQTAEAVSRGNSHGDLAVQVVPELYEMDYGLFAGRNYDEVHGDMEQVLDAWRMGFVEQSFPGGESPILAQHRVRPFAQRALAQAARQDLVVVAHGRINRILLATWTGAGLTKLEDFPQSNAAISELEVSQDGVMLKRLNDTSHLDLQTDAFS